MQSAQPTFLTEDKRFQGVKAIDLACDIKDREHHASWHQGINHPDANLIAASPDLYDALKSVIESEVFDTECYTFKLVQSALAKADGKGE